MCGRWQSRGAWLGPLLDWVKLNAVVSRRTSDGQLRLAKKRRWFARWLIPPGNYFMRWLRARVQVLPNAPWQAREIEVNRRLHGFECEIDARGWLLLPLWPGRRASDYCADRSIPLKERLRALGIVVGSLHALHAVSATGVDKAVAALSHGDATLRNVVYDPQTSHASWIDFDMAHDPADPVERHADDVRTVLYSALETMQDAPVETILAAVRAAYDDPAIWSRFRERLIAGPLHAGAFHMAQAAPSAHRRREVERWILDGG